MNRFVHVGFGFPGVPKMRDLEPVMTAVADDWIRYSAMCWILWTAKSNDEIFANIFRHIDHMDNVLVANLDLANCVGRLPPWAWTWINGKGMPTIHGAQVEQNLNRYFLPKP